MTPLSPTYRTPRHRTPRTVAAMAVLCLVGLTGCAGDGPAPASESALISAPTPSSTDPSGSADSGDAALGGGTFTTPSDADRSDADSTARVTALVLHSWDTTVDRTETAAAIRATDLMSDEWAGHQVEPERNASQGDWLEPAEHSAYSVPRAVPAVGDGSQDVAEDKAIRVLDVTWRWDARDDAALGGTGHRQVTVYLEKTDGRWDVVGHEIRDMTASRIGER